MHYVLFVFCSIAQFFVRIVYVANALFFVRSGEPLLRSGEAMRGCCKAAVTFTGGGQYLGIDRASLRLDGRISLRVGETKIM